MESVMKELDELRKAGHISHDELVFESQAEGPSADVSNMVLVDNIPRVEKDRVEKLIAFTRKTFEKVRCPPLARLCPCARLPRPSLPAAPPHPLTRALPSLPSPPPPHP